MRIGPLNFTKLWTNAADFPTYEASETQVRTDMQYLFNEIRDFINDKVLGAVNTITAGDITVQNEQGAESLSERLSEIAADIDGLEQELQDVSVGTMPDRSITNVKIGYREVHTENIAEGAVGTDQLADGSVDSVVLADEAVRTEKLEDRAVTTAKIANGAVTGAKMSDTHWTSVTSFNGNQFESFSTDSPVRYRKIGSVVYLTGALKPVSALPTMSPTNVPIEYVAFELPSGYIPSKTIVVLCQGNGDKKWKLQIYPNGRVTVSRYSGNAGYVDLPAGDWLPFHVSFPVD